MAATDDVFVKLKNQLAELQRHRDGRKALHIRVSRLERHFKEGHYRRMIAALLRPLVEKHGAVIHPLPSADLVIVTRSGTFDDLLLPLSNVYKEFQKSAAVAGLNAQAGHNDNFTSWYDLEEDYDALVKDVELLSQGAPSASVAAASSSTTSKSGPLSRGTDNSESPGVKNKPGVRYVGIDAPKKETVRKEFDPELLVALTGALKNADVSTFIRKQQVMAMVLGHGAIPVMVHRTAPKEVIFDHLLRETQLTPNSWLNGYIADLVADRVLRSEPNMVEKQSLASSISVTVEAVLSDAFDVFEKAQGTNLARSKIVLEFSVYDLLANSDRFLMAREKIKALGYKYCISGINLVSFGWVSKELLDADFIKISYPEDLNTDWLDAKRTLILKTRIKDIGSAKFILSDCNQTSMIETGQSLGFTLFQGSAVA